MLKKGYKALLDEANAQVTAIPAAEALSLSDAGDVVFVDLRDPREREREGAIPNAFSCPRGMLEFWIDPESPYAKPVFQDNKRFVFYCASGWRSALAAKTAEDMGLENVCHIEGGFSAWKAAGGAVETIARR
jgi:Rhodanese-related sulfurtransferase